MYFINLTSKSPGVENKTYEFSTLDKALYAWIKYKDGLATSAWKIVRLDEDHPYLKFMEIQYNNNSATLIMNDGDMSE